MNSDRCLAAIRGACLGTPLLLAACAATPPAPDTTEVLRQAEAAMGAAPLHTLRFSGRGTGGTFGQAWQPAMGWPGLNYSVLSRHYDFDNAAFREYTFKTFEANVLDMETAAVAHVAYSNGVPYIAFRSLSDHLAILDSMNTDV